MTAHNHKPIALSDLNLASFLLATGYPIQGIQGTPPRVEFLFSVPEQVLLAYYQGKDQVSARALLDAKRNLMGLARQRR